MLQAIFKLLLSLEAPQLAVLTTKPLLWHKDTFRAISGCLSSHWLLSDVDWGLLMLRMRFKHPLSLWAPQLNMIITKPQLRQVDTSDPIFRSLNTHQESGSVASQIQTPTAYISTTAKTTKPQLRHIDTFRALFGSLNPHWFISDVQFGLRNVASQIQTSPVYISTTAHSENHEATALTCRRILSCICEPEWLLSQVQLSVWTSKCWKIPAAHSNRQTTGGYRAP